MNWQGNVDLKQERRLDILRLERISRMVPGQVFVGRDGTHYPLSSEAIERAATTVNNLKGQLK